MRHHVRTAGVVLSSRSATDVGPAWRRTRSWADTGGWRGRRAPAMTPNWCARPAPLRDEPIGPLRQLRLQAVHRARAGPGLRPEMSTPEMSRVPRSARQEELSTAPGDLGRRDA